MYAELAKYTVELVIDRVLIKTSMYSIQLILLNILLLCNICESARILAIMPTPSVSHQVVFQPLWKSLLQRGHQLTLLTTDPIKDANYSGLRQIDWSFAYKLWHEKHNFSNIVLNFRQNKLKSFNQYVALMHEISYQELEHEDVQKLIHDNNEHFDLVIIEFLYPTMLAFSERFKCSFIGVSSMDIPTFGHEAIGNPTNPALYTDFLVPFDSKMNYFERVLNTLNYLGTFLYFHCYMYPKEDASVKSYFGENIPKLKDIQKKASLIFLNTHPVLHDVRPLMPKVVQIGGAIHLHKLKALPEDLERFLNSSEKGAIYFSLGSNVKVRDLPKDTFTILLETFAQLPFKVVFKVEETDLIKNVSNIYTGKWLPQQEILAHKSIKAFITQGGQQSLEEAIYYGVPIIGLPFYVDQLANIRRLSRKGACIDLDVHSLKIEEFQKAVYEITTNQSYLEAVQELSVLLKEGPITNLEKAVWWTEYVIRHKGAKILNSDIPYVPYYQYYLLDVIATFVFILMVVLFIEYRFVKCIIKYIRYKMRDDKLYKVE